MNIDKFSVNNQLVEIKLNTEEILDRYGEEIIFYTHSHPKLTTYFKFFQSRLDGDYESLEALMRDMILNSEGKPAIKSDQTLPTDIFTAAILAVGDILGKSVSKTSKSEVGTLTE